MYLYQNRLEATVDTANALESFKVWLGKAYSDPKAKTQVAPSTEQLLVPVVYARGALSATVTAEIGMLDRAAWDRANEDFKRNFNEFERGGRKGLQPNSPNKKNYYQKSRVEKRISSGFNCVFSIFGGSEGPVAAIAKDLGKAAEKIIQAQVQESSFGEDGNADARYDAKAIEKRVGAFAVDALKPERAKALKGYDKIYSDDIDNLDSTARAVVREVPFIVMKYESRGKSYVYAVDAVSGKIQVGTKPLMASEKFIRVAAGIGFGILAGYAYVHYVSPYLKSVF